MASVAIDLRKTPRQARARITFDAIIEAATQLLREGGLAALNTNAIAERAGVSIGSLYQYFPNKDALMVEMIRREQQSHVARLAAALPFVEALDLDETVHLLVRTAMAHHREDALYASAIDHEESRLPVDSIVADSLDTAGRLVETLLARFASEIGPIDGIRLAKTVPVMVRSIVDVWSNSSEPKLDVAEEEAVRAVLGYLKLGAN